VKKKYTIPNKDKNDWVTFTKKMGTINPKQVDLAKEISKTNKVPTLDLHGFSLSDANKEAEKFILKSFKLGFEKISIITGKGSRSKSYKDPYISEKLSILKYSVPDYISNNMNLSNKINKTSEAPLKHGGDGVLHIFFKKNKKL
jgi:DNA-nicking Smr family endonuclease